MSQNDLDQTSENLRAFENHVDELAYSPMGETKTYLYSAFMSAVTNLFFRTMG